MLRLTLMAVLVGGCIPLASAQNIPGPEVFDAMAQKSLAAGKAPGFALVVQDRDQVVFARGYGLSDIGAKTQVTADTPFAVGSISKQFAAVSILQLAERGKLALADPLSKYFPALPNSSKITLKMLLNQTSGLHNFPLTTEHKWPLSGTIAPATLLAILATDKADFEPGTKWEYSNTNYAVLAAIVEKVSGQAYGEYLAANIFRPLHMTASGNGFAAQASAATPYAGTGSFTRQSPLSLDLFFGAGSIVASANDLARWDEALLTGKLLNADSTRLLWTSGHLPSGEATKYAMGFVADVLQGHRYVWHNGFSPGAGGYGLNAIFPDDRWAIVVVSNGANFTGQPEVMVRQIFEAILHPSSAAAAPDSAAASPHPAATSPATAADEAVTALVLKVYRQMMAGKVDSALLSPEMNAALTPDVAAQASVLFQALGEPTKLTQKSQTPSAGATSYVYTGTFTTGEFQVLIEVNQAGQVSGYRLAP